MPWCVVQKRFGGTNGIPYLVGQLIELPDGTRFNQLTEQRFVRTATQAEVDSAEEVDVEVAPPRTETTTVRRRGSKSVRSA